MKPPTIDQLKCLYDVDVAEEGFEHLAPNRDIFHATVDRLSDPRLAVLWNILKTLRCLDMAVYYTAHTNDYGIRIGDRKPGPEKAERVLSRVYCNTGELEFDINLNPAQVLKGFNLPAAGRTPLYDGDRLSTEGQRWLDVLDSLACRRKDPIQARFRSNDDAYDQARAERSMARYLPRDFPARKR